VTPDGSKVYVTNEDGNTVSVIATASNTVGATVAVGTDPVGVAVTPDGSKVYVANNEPNTVSVIATASNTVTGTIAVGSGPFAFGSFIGPPTLTVAEAGTGSGQVTSSPANINCSTSSNACAAMFPDGTPVTLTASAAAGSALTGWSGGGCGGTGTCLITPTSDTTVTATFNQIPSFMLSVTPAGAGSGTVTSSPSGINCGAACNASYQSGTQVTLTASAANGSTFAGWSGGGCSGTNTCVVTLSQAQSVTATFTLNPASEILSVTANGTGSGAVTSAPSGINCGATCQASFNQGTQITLSAIPSAGSTFAGWSGGGCSGIVSCTLTLNSAATVTAGFVANTSGNLTLVAAVLPTSRSVQVGATPTAFATIIDAGPDNAATCTIAPATSIPASFLFQTTDPTTNALTGTANTPANIAAGQAQSFVIAFTPTAAFAPTNIAFTFTCANAPSPAASLVGVNTLNLSASTTPVPDIVALAASGDPGFVDIPGATGTGVFAVATVNLGSDATITASANTGSANLPVTLTVCQTNPTSGACLANAAASASTDIQPNATPTFGIFVAGSAAVANMPGVNRVFVTFTDSGGVLRGETSVAVRTQ
jgi:YVTN family beta-propeller protein